MNEQARDELIVNNNTLLNRLDERTTKMDERLGRIQFHQEKQNGAIAKAIEMSSINEANTKSLRALILWVATIGGAILLTLASWIVVHMSSVVIAAPP
jgi:hypothetical protein